MKSNENFLTENISTYNIETSRKNLEWVNDVAIDNFNDYSLDIEGGVKYLLIDDQYNVEKDKITKFYRTIRQPVNMQGVEYCSKFMLELNPKYNKLIIHNILVTRDNCKLDKLESSDMQVLRREYQAEQNVLSGDITLSIVLDDVKENDIIEFSYSLINYNEINILFFNRLLQLEYSVPVFKLHLAVIAESEMQYKFFGKEYKVQKNKNNDKIIYTIYRENLLPQQSKKYLPYWRYPISIMQIGFYTNWKDISSYIGKCFDIVNIHHEIVHKFKHEVKDKDFNKEEIILNVLNLIYKNIRYFSNHKATDYIKPTNPNLVLTRCYGDCKDFVNLFRNMLAVFEIQSYPVLVHTQYGKALESHLPSASMFDHVIIQIRFNNENYFIDPTIRQEVTSLKNIYLPDYGWGLVCDGVADNLLKINNKISPINYISVSDEYHCSSWKDNEFIFKSRVILNGYQALRFKQILESQSESKILEKILDCYNHFMEIKEVIDNKIENFENVDNEITYTLCYRISLKTMVENNGEYSIEVLPVDILEEIYYKLPSKVDSDLYYGPAVNVDYCISIIDSKTNFSGKKELIVSNDIFVLSKQSEGKDGRFEFKYQFKKNNDLIPLEGYTEFLSKHNDALNILPAGVTKHSTVNINFIPNIQTIYQIILVIAVVVMSIAGFLPVKFFNN